MSPVDGQALWDQYTIYKQQMFGTHTLQSWIIIQADNSKNGQDWNISFRNSTTKAKTLPPFTSTRFEDRHERYHQPTFA
ncbi:MAG: hypothetical protein R2877_05160 [Bdellovibrionota bacterium]